MTHVKVTLNISGEIYETLEKTLSRYPQTLLGDQTKRESYYCSRSNQYFFNRNRSCFGAILYFYQSKGILSCPSDIPFDDFESECHFFQLPKSCIFNMKMKLGLLYNRKIEIHTSDDNTVKKRVWKFLENPESSTPAEMFTIFSLLMITVSVITTCLETLPELLVKSNDFMENPWALIELTLNVWFLLELSGRFFSCPSKVKFLRSTMNCLDMAAVIPYFVLICISKDDVKSVGFLRILKIMRVIRLYRLSKHSVRLRLVGNIIKSSLGDLQLLLLCLALLVIFGGSLMYFIESYHHSSQFTSIPQALWWGIQTITTVGYGDIVPLTILGKVLSSFFMAFGALTVSLPVLSIVTRFTTMYYQNLNE